MAGLKLSGLASGLDWKSVVDQLMNINRAPITRLRQEQSTLNTRSSALSEIRTLLTQFETSLKSLSGDASFQNRSATVSGGSSWTATASAGTSPGSYSFNVTQAAAAAKRTGAADVTSGISATNDVSGLLISSLRTAQSITAGEFTINGSKISVESTDTLQDVFDRIQTNTAGAVTASYDAATDRVTLSGAGPITLGSAADNSNFLSAFKLFNNGTDSITSSGNLGVAKTSVPLAQAGFQTAIANADGDGNSMFRINGVDISYNVNTDSIDSVLSKINKSAAGVTATYDSADDRFILTNKSTGDVGMFLEEVGSGFLAASGLTSPGSSFQSGANAVFSINGGGSITSVSNTLDESVHGIKGLSLTTNSTGTSSVTVSADTSAARTQIDDIIAKYNAVQSAIERHTKITVNGTNVTSAALAGNRDVDAISTQLRSLVFESGSGLSGSIKRLSDIGIDFSGQESTLSVRNATLLTDKLASAAAEVEDFFTNTSSGFIKRLTDFTERTTASTGTLTTQTDNITKQNTSITTQIAEIERQIERQRELMESSFIQMETASSFYQQQAQMLTNAFSQTKK